MNSRNRKSKATLTTGPDAGQAISLGPERPTTEEDWRQQREDERNRVMAQVGATITVLAPAVAVLFDQLQGQIFTAMQANGFWDGGQDNFGQKTALVHSELSEMLEANRKSVKEDDKIPAFTGEEAEAADTLIRMLDMSGRYNWRLGEAVVAKMQFNLSRPYKHDKRY